MYTEEDSALWLANCLERDRYGAPEPLNIFYLDQDPQLAARAHCDAHVVKMVLETAQLLSGAHHLHGRVEQEWSLFVKDLELPRLAEPFTYTLGGHRVYVPTHLDHPCAVWARASRENYDWLWRLGMWLLEEFTFRYGRQHASAPVLWALETKPSLPRLDLSEPPCAMPEEVKAQVDGYYDAVESYRNYYLVVKKHLLKWTKRPAPEWALVLRGNKRGV